MKQQIARLTPHQNGKVIGVLMAIGSLVFVLPMVVVFSFAAPRENVLPGWTFLCLPILYLVFGYISVAVSCLVYNAMFKVVGGLEFEAKEPQA